MKTKYFKTYAEALAFLETNGLTYQIHKNPYIMRGEVASNRINQFGKGYAIQRGVCGSYFTSIDCLNHQENETMKTNEELERAVYVAGDTDKAALYAIAHDMDQLDDGIPRALDIADIPSTIEAYYDLGSAEEIREKLEQLEHYKEFFNDCFTRLAGLYPCPSVTSDYDKSVIFAAIDKGEGTLSD